MKEQVFFAPCVDKSKTFVREPLDGAFCHCLIPQIKCAAALPKHSVQAAPQQGVILSDIQRQVAVETVP